MQSSASNSSSTASSYLWLPGSVFTTAVSSSVFALRWKAGAAQHGYSETVGTQQGLHSRRPPLTLPTTTTNSWHQGNVVREASTVADLYLPHRHSLTHNTPFGLLLCVLQLWLEINLPPSNGSVLASPATGICLSTNFTYVRERRAMCCDPSTAPIAQLAPRAS